MALPRRRASEGEQARPATASAPGPDWRDLYAIENPGEVEAYVRRHPFLVPLLLEAPNRIAALFGSHSGLALEAPVFADDGTQHLYLNVRTADPVDVVMARLERLEEGWWLDAMLQAHARMTVDVELI